MTGPLSRRSSGGTRDKPKNLSTYSQRQINDSFHIEQLKPELNKQVEHVSLSLHFKIYPLLFTGSFSLLFVISFCLCLSFY